MPDEPAFSLRGCLAVALLVFLLSACVSLPQKDDFLGVRPLPHDSGASSPESPLVQSHLRITRHFGYGPPVPGNSMILLKGGESIYANIFQAIENASKFVHIETFLIVDDRIGIQLSNLLRKKRAEGVEVSLIYDSYGCRKTPREFFRRLEASGVQTLEYNPINYFNPLPLFSSKRKPTRRDHRKIVIVDGVTAFIGSTNFGNVHNTAKKHSHRRIAGKYWQDFHLQIDGPAAADLERLFLKTWEEWKGPRPDRARYFPPGTAKGTHTVQIIGSKAGRMNRVNYMAYVSAFANARRSIHLVTPYLAPCDEFLEELLNAAGRGVDIRIVVPRFSDSNLASHAGRFHYRRLIESGIKIYLHPGMIHAKAAVVDGVWSVVGTTNLDSWSLMGNDEADAFVFGREFAAELESQLHAETAKSHRIKRTIWFNRPFGERLKDWLGHIFHFWA